MNVHKGKNWLTDTMGKAVSAMKKTMPKSYKGKSTKVGGGGRFAMMESKLAKEGVNDPGAVAASIGRKKYGKAKFQKMAKTGKNRSKK